MPARRPTSKKDHPDDSAITYVVDNERDAEILRQQTGSRVHVRPPLLQRILSATGEVESDGPDEPLGGLDDPGVPTTLNRRP